MVFRPCAGLHSAPRLLFLYASNQFLNIAIVELYGRQQSTIWKNCRSLKKVVSLIDVPFAIDTNVFSTDYSGGKYVLSSDVTLYVPKGTKTLYESTEGWSSFTNIVEDDYSTGISDITVKQSVDTKIYDLSGRRLSEPRKGINIIGGRKVIVR